MFVVDFVMDMLFRTLIILTSLVGTLVVAGAILGILKNINSRYIQLAIGWEGILMTAWIGTPIHELGHAIMCLIFGHKIVEMKLLRFGDEPVLGYVNHAYNRNSIYQKVGNFFIGIGPIISGTLVIILIMALFLPHELDIIRNNIKVYSWDQITSFNFLNDIRDVGIELFKSMFILNLSHYKTFQFWIFIVLAVSISSHMALSMADMKGAFNGLIALFVISLILNLIYPVFSSYASGITHALLVYNSYMIFALLIAIFFSMCSTAISLALYGIRIMLSG